MTKLFALMITAMLAFGMSVQAEGKKSGKAGDGFRKAAVNYEKKAATAFKNKEAEVAKCFRQMAAIKRNAAALADQGKWKEISWKEYHQLEGKINKLRGNECKGCDEDKKGKAKKVEKKKAS